MKRKMTALAMCAAMVVLTACGGGQNAPAQTTAAAQASQAAETEAEAGAETEGEAAETEEASGTLAGDPSTSTWPGGTVQLYVPAAAGGGSDMLARVFAQAITEETGSNFVVLNDATGGGSVAAENVRNAKTDGLNLYLGHTGLCGSIAMGQYDHSFDDFQILGTITDPGENSNVICVNKDVPYNTLDELIAGAQEKPGEMLVGVQANGNRHFMQLLFQKSTGTEFTIVDCGGVADTISNLVGGMVDMAILPIANAEQYVEVGDLKALAITGDQRVEAMPDVATMEELGYESCDIPSISVLMGPKGMSEDDVAKINETMKTVLERDDVKEQYVALSMEAYYNTPEDSAAVVAEMQELYDTGAAMMNQ